MNISSSVDLPRRKERKNGRTGEGNDKTLLWSSISYSISKSISESKQQNSRYWKMVLEDVERLGFMSKNTGVQESLSISYNDLPSDQLKLCFRYLGSLPNGYEIEVEKLFQLWVAESMITTWQHEVAE
ncbi:hypothetical protein LguiB_025931 [Lonicera macranthoides]